ncbi:hypothetical protein T472_0210450 [Youngiibacter fragilis 232.1]|uniref:Uncharacterized protein n=1 Tax=Youngiibacter fragilis 232.1 TaxID=994573 RepID=V7I393_9CLOT|nr:hypothetical protein T472_0210450 [Youngiibacter fragilis 232.1]
MIKGTFSGPFYMRFENKVGKTWNIVLSFEKIFAVVGKSA